MKQDEPKGLNFNKSLNSSAIESSEENISSKQDMSLNKSQ